MRYSSRSRRDSQGGHCHRAREPQTNRVKTTLRSSRREEAKPTISPPPPPTLHPPIGLSLHHFRFSNQTQSLEKRLSRFHLIQLRRSLSFNYNSPIHTYAKLLALHIHKDHRTHRQGVGPCRAKSGHDRCHEERSLAGKKRAKVSQDPRRLDIGVSGGVERNGEAVALFKSCSESLQKPHLTSATITHTIYIHNIKQLTLRHRGLNSSIPQRQLSVEPAQPTAEQFPLED